VYRLLRLLGLALGVLWVGPAAADQGELTIDFLDVGHGEAVLVRAPEGNAALIDAGPRRKDVAGMLSRRGVQSLDLVVVTNHHAGRIGNMAAVIERFKPKAYLDTGFPYTNRTYRRLERTVKKSAGLQVLRPYPDKERQIDLGSVVLRVFPQPPADPKRENNNSIGIRLEYKDFSAVLTGDSESKERKWWAKHADPGLYRKTVVLKVAHYGSRKGLDKTWLKAADPKLAIACCGKGNKHGYPQFKTTDLLDRADVRLLRTDRHGTITVTSDGTDCLVKPERESEEGDYGTAGGAAGGRGFPGAGRAGIGAGRGGKGHKGGGGGSGSGHSGGGHGGGHGGGRGGHGGRGGGGHRGRPAR
jgi:beta-lactamase superfamily II metal-dependent hydrolase